MKNKIIFLLTLMLPSVAMSADYTKLSTGFFMSKGLSTTSSATNSTLYAVPIMLALKRGRFNMAVSNGVAVTLNNSTTFRSFVSNVGFADSTLSVGYDLTEAPWWSIKIKQKFATGSTSAGLSTGEDDTSVQVDYFKILNSKTSLFSTLGYKAVGKVSGEPMQNATYATLGLGRVINTGFNLGASLDYRQAVYTTQPDQVGLSLFADKKLSKSFNISTFGSYDDSDTLSLGVTVSYRL